MSSGMKSSRASNSTNSKNSVKKSAENTDSKVGKSQPTADQIRIAQLTDNTANAQDTQMKELIDQYVQCTGQDREEAIVFLHDHDNNLTEAVNAFFEGESTSSGWSERTKKKKAKAKPEVEVKDNRRGANDNRDRSGSRPRGGSVRGRGRGRRIDADGGSLFAGRGGSSGRRGGRFPNGGGPGAGFRGGRGGRSFRGGRGGGVPFNSELPRYNDTFSNQTYMESPVHQEEDWGSSPVTEATSWGNNPVDDDEDWGNTAPTTDFSDPTVIEEFDEWTGSLDGPKVFVASQQQQQQQQLISEDPSPPPASDLTPIDAAKLVNSSLSYSSKLSESSNKTPSFAAAAAAAPLSNPAQTSAMPNGATSASVMMPQSPVQQKQVSPPQPPMNSAAMDLVTLLQQAKVSVPSQQHQSVVPNSSSQMMSGMSSSVAEVAKPNPLPVPANYANSINQHYPAAQPTPMYPPGMQPHSNTNSQPIVAKAKVTLPPENMVEMPAQARPSTRPPKATTKIPSLPVEMPEDNLASVNMQLSGLKFGNDEFDFLASENPSGSSNQPEPIAVASEPEAPVANESVVTPASSAMPHHAGQYSNVNAAYHQPPPSQQQLHQQQPAVQPQHHQPTQSLHQQPTQPQPQQPQATPSQHTTHTPPQHHQPTPPHHQPSPPQQPPSSTPSGPYGAQQNPTSATQQQQQQQSMPSTYGYSNHSGYGSPLPGYSSGAPQQGYSAPQDARLLHKSPPHQQKQLGPEPIPFPPSSQQASASSLSQQQQQQQQQVPVTTPQYMSRMQQQQQQSQSVQQQASTATTPQKKAPEEPSPATQPSVSSSLPAMASLLPSAPTTTAPQLSTANTYNSSYNLTKSSFPSPPSSHYSQQQQQQVKYQNDMPAASHYSSQSNTYTSQQYQYNGGESTSATTSTTTASPTTSTIPHSLKTSTTPPQPSKPLNSSSNSVSESLAQSQQQHSQHVHQPTQQQVQQLVLGGQQSAGQFVGSGLQGNTLMYPAMQQPMYGYEHVEMMQRMLHNPGQAPSTLSGSRDGSGLSSGGYSGQDLAKFRQDQNSSPVPSALGTQGSHGGYLNSNTMHPMYMYQNMVPNNFGQYAPAIIQLPANTASQTSQYQPAKLQYNATPTYYDTQNPGDYKAAYGSGAVSSQSKQPNSSGMSNSVADLPNYKNHLAKSYDKPGSFHTSTPPPFNLAGSGAPYGHTPVYLPTIPPAQHHSTLLHHQLHQDANAPRGPASGQGNKAKPSYSGQAFWGSS